MPIRIVREGINASARINMSAEEERCLAEMALIDALPLTGPPEYGPTLGWLDWWSELQLIREEAKK